MTTIDCDRPGCEFQITGRTAAHASAAIVGHILTTHPASVRALIPAATRAPEPSRRPPPLDRPALDLQCTPAAFSDFSAKWACFKAGSGLAGDATIRAQLLECLSEELFSTFSLAVPAVDTLNEDRLLSEIKRIAVIPVSLGIRRSEALSARQQHAERFQAFASRVRGLVIDCDFTVTCPHATSPNHGCSMAGCAGVDYTDAVIRDILPNGIGDAYIRRDILGTEDTSALSVNRVI